MLTGGSRVGRPTCWSLACAIKRCFSSHGTTGSPGSGKTWPTCRNDCCRYLLARKPKWLAGWLEKEWKQEKPIPNGYVEEGLIQAGLIDVPPSEDHLNRLGDDSMDRYPSDASKTDKFRGHRRTIKQKFESAPELWGRNVWLIFEYDSHITRYSFKKWGDALRELSLEGKLDRTELLQRSLIGMSLPLSPLTLTGMGKLHKLLAPTIEEQEQLQTEYLRLLGASESTVMSLALATCDNLLKAKQLDGVAFFDALPAVFRCDKKTPPMKATEHHEEAH